jgi:hypothetical protein
MGASNHTNPTDRIARNNIYLLRQTAESLPRNNGIKIRSQSILSSPHFGFQLDCTHLCQNGLTCEIRFCPYGSIFQTQQRVSAADQKMSDSIVVSAAADAGAENCVFCPAWPVPVLNFLRRAGVREIAHLSCSFEADILA